MNLDQRNEILYRIMSDYYIIFINNKKYIMRRPTSSILYKAQLEYEKILSKYKFNDWMSESECINHLIDIGKWTLDGDAKMKEIEKFVEDHKVLLYQSFIQLDKVKQIRQHLIQAKQLLGRLYNAKHSLYSFTLACFSQTIKQNYIIEHTVYSNGQRLSYVSPKLLELIKIKISRFAISSAEFRETARTDPWRSYYGITDNPFSRNITKLDYDKRTLLMYSKMYDNIYENPECPNEDIIEDDDMLDGWMILQKRERDEKKQEKQGDSAVQKLSSKYDGAHEIFLPAQSIEQADYINKMNSSKSKIVKQQRQKIIKEKGSVGTGQLPDEIFKQNLQANKQFVESVKNK